MDERNKNIRMLYKKPAFDTSSFECLAINPDKETEEKTRLAILTYGLSWMISLMAIIFISVFAWQQITEICNSSPTNYINPENPCGITSQGRVFEDCSFSNRHLHNIMAK